MLLPQIQYPAGGFRGGTADLANTPEKEFQPSFPMAVIADRHKPVIILGTMEFEVMAQIQQREFQNTPLAE